MTFDRLKIQFSFQNQFVEIENEYFSQPHFHSYNCFHGVCHPSDVEQLVWCPSVDWRRNLHWDWDWEPQPVTVSPQVWPHLWWQGGVLVGMSEKIFWSLPHGNIYDWTTIITQSLTLPLIYYYSIKILLTDIEEFYNKTLQILLIFV